MEFNPISLEAGIIDETLSHIPVYISNTINVVIILLYYIIYLSYVQRNLHSPVAVCQKLEKLRVESEDETTTIGARFFTPVIDLSVKNKT